jgi:photosystem II stability/assembly factor-like uncharacterized protein
VGRPKLSLAVSFTDANTGTAVGLFGTILRTTNGGASWVQQPSGTTDDLDGVSFTDTLTGTVVGGYCANLRTTDGGATWTQQACPEQKPLTGISFADANVAVVVGSMSEDWLSGVILRTTNGGATWIDQDGMPNLLGVSMRGPTTATRALRNGGGQAARKC